MRSEISFAVAIGIAALSGCAPGTAETNAAAAPSMAAPTPLVPPAYAGSPAQAAVVAPAPIPAAPPTRLAPAADGGARSSGASSSVMIFNPYHPYWMVEVP